MATFTSSLPDDLLEKLSQTEGDSPERQILWRKFYCDVSAHAAAEEESFYGELITTEKGQPRARHSVAEHKEIDDILQELNDTDMSPPGWLLRFKTLRHEYEHHIDEEEEEIFQRAHKTIGEDENGEIAREFLTRKNKERELETQKAEGALEA